MDDLVKLPQAADDPPYILFFQLPDVFPVGAAAGVGILLDQLSLCLLIALALLGRYRRFREGKHKAFFTHWLHSVGFGIPRGHVVPEPFVRVFLP
jgi:type IV conjugative transfer system protein TraL